MKIKQFKLVTCGLSLISLVSAQALAQLSKGVDPFFSKQWGLVNSGEPQNIELDFINRFQILGRAHQDISLPLTQAKASQRKKIIVAVLDTGIDTTHPDLKEVLQSKPSECQALAEYQQCLKDKDQASCEEEWVNLENPKVDQDKNGYPMDCNGWSVFGGNNRLNIMGSPILNDLIGHGTHVAGIIGAQAENGFGTQGVSQHIELLPVQVITERPREPIKPLNTEVIDLFNPSETGKEDFQNSLGDFIARGLIYAVNSGAQVINLSLGWPQSADSKLLRQAIAEAQKRNVLIVAAAGNDSTRSLLKPCSYPNVICVAAHGPDGALSSFTNYGSGVDIAAPGTNILSSYPLNLTPNRVETAVGIDYMNGTSQAAPFVTGAIAEMLYRGVPVQDIRARLIAGGRPVLSNQPIQRLLHSGAPQKIEVKPSNKVEAKWIMGGLLDLNRALNMSPVEVIAPVSKEPLISYWNRQERLIRLVFPLTNLWQTVDVNELSVTAQIKAAPRSIRPTVKAATLQSANRDWKRNQMRQLEITIAIEDSVVAKDTQIPSDLDFEVSISSPRRTAQFTLEAELIVPISATTQADESYRFENLPEGPFSMFTFNEIFDQKKQVDYVISTATEKSVEYSLYKAQGEVYKKIGSLSVDFTGDEKYLEIANGKPEFATQRFAMNGKTYYSLGLRTDRTSDEKEVDSTILLLDENFALLQTFKVTTATVSPISSYKWILQNQSPKPIWLGRGVDLSRPLNLEDHWDQTSDLNRPAFRVYFFNSENKLSSVDRFLEFKIEDILETPSSLTQLGKVDLLVSKDAGSEAKPSFVKKYGVLSLSGLSDLKRENIKWISTQSFTNLSEGLKDPAIKLSGGNTVGTSWTTKSTPQKLKVNVLKRTDSGTPVLLTRILSAAKEPLDAALAVRSGFAGSVNSGVFAVTNSEVQYHNLNDDSFVSTSMNRFTFLGRSLFYFMYPCALTNSKDSSELLPGFYTSESTGLSKGLKIKTIAKDKIGLIEIVSPAKLRFESESGCRQLDTLVLNRQGQPAVDFRCGNQLLRMNLKY